MNVGIAKDLVAATPITILMILAILGIQDHIGVQFTLAGIGFIVWLAWGVTYWIRRLNA